MYIVQGDPHVHSTYSDGALAPKDIVSVAESKALDFIGIADHNTIEGSREMLRELSMTQSHVIGLSNQEISLGHQLHLLIMGSRVAYKSPSLRHLSGFCKKVREDGGAIIIAHPWSFFHNRRTIGILDEIVENKLVDGLELINVSSQQQIEKWKQMLEHYKKRWMGTGLAITGGSDWHSFHHRQLIGMAKTYLWTSSRSERGIVEALRKGYSIGALSIVLLKEINLWDKVDEILRSYFYYPGKTIYRDGFLGPPELVEHLLALKRKYEWRISTNMDGFGKTLYWNGQFGFHL